jgi:hypothetical protein
VSICAEEFGRQTTVNAVYPAARLHLRGLAWPIAAPALIEVRRHASETFWRCLAGGDTEVGIATRTRTWDTTLCQDPTP